MEQRWPIRVYYEDTDHSGMVYHANYLRYMERARTEFLRQAGIELDAVFQQWGVIFAVTQLSINYHYPARFNDGLQVISSIQRLHGARLCYQQRIERCDDGRSLTSATVHLACLGEGGKPCRIPQPLHTSLCAWVQTIQGEHHPK